MCGSAARRCGRCSRSPALIADPIGQIFSGSGFVWYGGLLGGTLGVTYKIYREGLSWLMAVDCIAPGLAIGQAIGRVGCQLAGDGDWGKVPTCRGR